VKTPLGQAWAHGPVNGLDERTDAGSYIRVGLRIEQGDRETARLVVRLPRGAAETLREELSAALEAYKPDFDTERPNFTMADVLP
jgi:hypothetical protein